MVRRKLEIKKIEDNSKRMVAFTKRRKGLFKKADTLCTKCDAQIAIMAISAAGNCYSFGDPAFESVIRRYKAVKAQQSDQHSAALNNLALASASTDILEYPVSVPDENEEDMNLDLCLGPMTEVKEGRMRQNNSEKGLVLGEDQEKDRKLGLLIDKLNWDELQQLTVVIEEMKKRVAERANEIQGLGQ